MIIKKDDLIDDWDPILLAYPFVRKGMTAEEYDKERKYLAQQNIEDIKNLKYKPLWKQREEQNGKR